ncbi:MAG: O-antigen ligase family protein [Elusimicrobiales bacterium]|nr:O-antigen ligase family protein [Elusimicrobiales bacterium]
MNNSVYNIFKKDVICGYLLFFVSIIVRYYIPKTIGDIFFIGLLGIFLFSKKNYFWLAFIFLLIDPPGFLFFEYGDFSLPALRISTMERSVQFCELFVLISLVKVILLKKKEKYFFAKPLMFLLYYLIFLLIITFSMEISLYKVLLTIRLLMPYLFLITLPRLLITKKDYIRFFNLLFSFVFLMLFAQLFDILLGKHIAYLFGETKVLFSGAFEYSDQLFDVSETVLRYFYGAYIVLISYIAALYFLVDKSDVFKKHYLVLIVFVSWLMTFLSATRGWIISFSFMFLMFIIIFHKNIRHIVAGAIIPILVIIILILSFSNVSVQFRNAWKRLETITLLAQGDISAGNTLGRITERGPRVMSKFVESPIIGFGFSDEYYSYADGHVGNQTMLLNGGILGYCLFVIFWLYFNISLFTKNRILSYKNSYKNTLLIFIIGFIGIFIIHSSSSMIFGYLINVPKAFTLTLFFVFADFAYKQATREDSLIKSNYNKR